MATPADQRLLELLEKWLRSLELHLKYASLDDDSYWKVQSWVKHQRPNRWLLELARDKTLALKSQLEERMRAGDAKFSDSLELLIFLANLVGSEHIERFIPTAEPPGERKSAAAAGEPARATGTDKMPRLPEVTATREMPKIAELTGTREMPKFVAGSAPVPPPVATTPVPRGERRLAAAPRPAPKSAPKSRGKSPEPAASAAGSPEEQVIADAARLVQWGRKWYELPELIARMADRPPLSEVRRILKENKNAIDQKAGIR